VEKSLPGYLIDQQLPADFSSIGSASWGVPARHDEPELLDQGLGSPADVRTNLMEMWRINRWLGGVGALTDYLLPLLNYRAEPLSLVDLGTGSGEIPLLIARHARKHFLPVKIYGLDVSGRNLAVAQANLHDASDIHLIQADVELLPFAVNEVDYYISTLFLHHFAPEQVISLLRELYRRSQRGIVMSDLVRGYLPLIAFQLIQPIFARHYLTRHDGALSIRRAYLPEELLMMAQAAGIENARVYRHFPWRMTLIAEKSLG
jgi:ubiquinone/menaquinone biosynthesis C-methylase UbiE